MPAETKAELVALTEKEYRKLAETIAPLTAAEAALPGAEGVSVKETVAHRAHWVELFLGWCADGRAGKRVHTPAPGWRWSELKAYNEKVREASRERPWDEVKAGLEAAHRRLAAFLEANDEAALYGARLYDWMNDWTLGRWAEANGASHYRSARKVIRKLVAEQAA